MAKSAQDHQHSPAMALPAGGWSRHALRAILSLLAAAAFLWLLSDRLSHINLAALAASFGQLSLSSWAAALGLTAISFWAVGRYDAVLHHHFATGLPCAQTRRAGVCAIAVSQTLGLGLITGAILRWRMLPGLSLWQATRLTTAVAISFLAGWAVVTSTVLLALPAAPFKPAAAVVLLAALAAACLSLAPPRRLAHRFRWPNIPTLARLTGLCAVDTLAAAAGLFALCPPDLALPFATLLPAFLLALGAGLALGSPGGMGAFEITLLALLPQTATEPLLAGVLAWRLAYYALPAVLGAGLAIHGPKAVPPPVPQALNTQAGAESGLIHQGDLKLEPLNGPSWLCGRTQHFLVGMADPSGPHSPRALDLALASLAARARTEARFALGYKISARTAARARAAGQPTRRIAWEAWLSPPTYHLAASPRAGLRRKLRRAEAAGVTVTLAHPVTAPWAALDRIAADWARAHGGERGFSMGRYTRDYLSHQRLYIAWSGAMPLAFVSFHTTPQTWALDLMRHAEAPPDGTMHLLIQTAIDDAARLGIARLSLAAVADGAVTPRPDLAQRLANALAPDLANPGLFRFKSAFAPDWHPLYLTAPNRALLALGAFDLARAITHPAPLMRQIEQQYADNEFAYPAAAWHIPRIARHRAP